MLNNNIKKQNKTKPHPKMTEAPKQNKTKTQKQKIVSLTFFFFFFCATEADENCWKGNRYGKTY